jgi:hypothetical protein
MVFVNTVYARQMPTGTAYKRGDKNDLEDLPIEFASSQQGMLPMPKSTKV